MVRYYIFTKFQLTLINLIYFAEYPFENTFYEFFSQNCHSAISWYLFPVYSLL